MTQSASKERPFRRATNSRRKKQNKRKRHKNNKHSCDSSHWNRSIAVFCWIRGAESESQLGRVKAIDFRAELSALIEIISGSVLDLNQIQIQRRPKAASLSKWLRRLGNSIKGIPIANSSNQAPSTANANRQESCTVCENVTAKFDNDRAQIPHCKWNYWHRQLISLHSIRMKPMLIVRRCTAHTLGVKKRNLKRSKINQNAPMDSHAANSIMRAQCWFTHANYST